MNAAELYRALDTRLVLASNHEPVSFDHSPQEICENFFRICVSKPKQLDLQKVHEDKNPIPPIVIAGSLGDIECLKHLIKKGACLDDSDEFGVTSLHMATQNGHLECVKLLLDAGANVNAVTTGESLSREPPCNNRTTPPHLAASSNQFSCTKEMKGGANYSSFDEYEQCVRTFLRNAGSNVHALLSGERDNRKPPYNEGSTPLHLAASFNQFSCIEELMKAGADYNAVDEYGMSPFFVAIQLEYDQCVQAFLRNAGLTISYSPSYGTGNTYLHFAVNRGLIFSVKELLRLGSDVSLQNSNGDTPLHICVKNFDCEADVLLQILKLLVLHGYNVDVNQEDSHGQTAVYYAAFNTSTEGNRSNRHAYSAMVSFLIAHGADINVKNFFGLNIMEYEYNSIYGDSSVIKTCVQSLKVPPSPDELEYPYFTALVERFPKHSIYCFTVLSSTGLAITPEMHQQLRHFSIIEALPIGEETAQKQIWYKKNVPYNVLPSLKHLCRHSIRSTLAYRNLKHIKDLCIPSPLKSYLLLEQDYTVDLEN